MCKSNAPRRTALIASFTASALLVLSGCAVDQERETAAYRDVLGIADQNAPSFEPNQPLSLPLALNLANWHNERLAIKGEDYLQALIDKDRAASVFLPKVSFVPSFTRQEKTSLPPGAAAFAEEIIAPRITDVPIQTHLDLNIPGDIANTERAESAAQQQRSLLLDLQDSVLLDAAKVYYQVLISEAQARVLAHSILVQEQSLRNLRDEYAAGAAKLLDVSQAQAQLSAAKVSFVNAETDIANGRSTLAFLTGQTAIRGSLADELICASLPSKDQLLTDAWQNRNDLIAAQYQLESASHLLQQAWSQYFPSIGLDFSWFLSRESFPSDVSWVGMLQVSVPLFDAGLIHDDVRTAWSLLRQAKLYQSYLQRQIDEEVTIALENITQTDKRIGELRIQVDAADLALRQANQNYDVGLAINLDRLVAQQQLLAAQLDLADAEFTRKIYYLQLLRATGRFAPDSLNQAFEPLEPQ